MDAVITWLQTLDGATVLVVLGICVFLESAAFLGLFAPGELALLSAGAAAAGGRTSLAGALAVGFAAAVLGEAVGYAWGRRQGPRLLAWAGRHPRLGRHLPSAVARVRARGFAVVILSRWNGMLRALVPIVAGSARMPVARFGAANVVGGALWTVAVTMAGRVAAESARAAGEWLTWTSIGAAGAIAVVLLLSRRGRTPAPQTTMRWRFVGGLALAVAAYILLTRVVGLDIGATVADLGRWPTLVAIMLELAALACLGQVYRTTFAATGGRIGNWHATRLGLGAFGFSQLLPGGGAVGSLYVARQFIRRHGADAAVASTATVLFGIVTMGALAGIASLTATTATILSPQYSRYAVVAIAATAAVLGVLLTLRALLNSPGARRWVAQLLARTLRRHAAAQEWERTLAVQAAHLRRPGGLLLPVAWSAMNWLLDMAVLALIAWAANLGLPLFAVVLAYVVGNLLNGLPLTPGGIGLVETGIVGTLVAFGADPAPASAVAISYRLIAHWLPLVVAGPVVVGELRTRRQEVCP